VASTAITCSRNDILSERSFCVSSCLVRTKACWLLLFYLFLLAGTNTLVDFRTFYLPFSIVLFSLRTLVLFFLGGMLFFFAAAFDDYE
jgi:hypothetical protein